MAWKSNPKQGIAPTNIRPLTNNDPGNIFPTGFGLPRPIKHYRKGRVIVSADEMDALPPSIARNVQRTVASSTTSYIQPNTSVSSSSCQTCKGNNVISNLDASTDKTKIWCNKTFCCNEERKARRRVLPPNTNVSNQYFQTTYMKLHNRCQTFQQRQFNFVRGLERLLDQYPGVAERMLKPGGALTVSTDVYYVAQCVPQEQGVVREIARQLAADGLIAEEVANQPDISITTLLTMLTPDVRAKVMQVAHQSFSKQCARVYYKPNNPQFASQGAVSSSQRTLKLAVNTLNASGTPVNQMATALQYGFNPNDVFTSKQKILPCNESN